VRSSLPLSLAGLAALLTFVLAGSAFARQGVHPDRLPSLRVLRADIDHYRSLTWTFERAAHLHRTPTSYSERRSTDPAYLQWTISVWSRRADVARDRALGRIRRRLAVAIPPAPRPHSRLLRRVTYSKNVALKLRRVYPGTVTRQFASARAATGTATLRLWQERLARATVLVLRHGWARPPIPAYLEEAFLCIHHFEGAWNANTGNGYYGGLQMDARFQSLYGQDFIRRWGTADNWPAWAQLQAAVRAYRSGRGFAPWPRTARACGLV
jgi:Transglycosylase-like domain